MAAKFRIPITAITVFGTSSLLALTVAIVLLLGFGQAAHSTRQLWADQSESLIDEMERSLSFQLDPIRDQAQWIAADIDDVSNPAALDDYMLGALAATPQVAGIAIIDTDGFSRRWGREARDAIDEDWSQEPWMMEYLELVANHKGPAWRDPIFTDTVNSSTLLHDIALRDAEGNFIGVFAQIIPIQELSGYLARTYTDTGVTPFVIYNRNFVLAHPAIFNGTEQRPLPSLEELGDLVLQRIWSPDEEAAFIQTALKDTRASGIFWGDNYYLFLYRELTTFGPVPWTIGAYLNTDLLPDDQTDRIFRALAAGLIIMLLSVIALVVVGRKISSPVKAFVQSANKVETGRLDEITPLGETHIRELDDAANAFNHMVNGLRERQLIRDTLGRFVPEKVASSLLAGGGQIDVQQTEATILFCDIEAFTRLTESLGPVRIVEVLNAYFSAMVDLLEARGGVVTQFQGDAILATFNVPVADPDHARNAVLAGREMLDSVEHKQFAGEKLKIRVGINTGPVVAGAIGARGRLNYTVHGDAVNRAARLESLNKEFGTRLLVAASTIEQIDDIKFIAVGDTAVRGQSEAIKLFTLASTETAE